MTQQAIRSYLVATGKCRDQAGSLDPAEYAYPHVEAFLLARGRPMPQRQWTPAERRAIRKITGWVRPKARACFQNCQEAVSYGRMLPKGMTLEYAEGIATHLIPTLHAWLLLNGTVWDPTWDLLEDQRARAYFGITVPVKNVLVSMVERKVYGSMLYDERGLPLLRKGGEAK